MKRKIEQLVLSIGKWVGNSLIILGLLTFQAYAQNATDSGLNKHITTTNWYEQGWLWAVIIGLLIIRSFREVAE